MGDSNPPVTFGYVAHELGLRKVGFICARERVGPDSLAPRLRAAFGGPYIVNGGSNAHTAQTALDIGWADAVAFGKAFLANPDLPARLRSGTPLNASRPDTFYFGGPEGYLNYPSSQ